MITRCACSRCNPKNECEHGIVIDIGGECKECNAGWDVKIAGIRTAIHGHEMSLYSLRSELEHLTGVRR